MIIMTMFENDIMIVITIVIMMMNNNTSDNDENDDNNKTPVDSPHKGSIMLRFDVTFVESKNNWRVSGDLGRHVPHVV